MSHCLCPNCGVELTITTGLRPSQQQGRRSTPPHGPSPPASAREYTLPLGREGRRLGDAAKRDDAV